ncbi:MAG TPA: DUF4129 domain-containing protein [Blastocatellia bacterium]|nr:DUF4129 domain-containing protein [Blastocatellia bacterium]
MLSATPVLLLAFAPALGADSLLRYEQRVKRATEQVQRIQADPDYAEDGINYIKTLLPGREEIDFSGETVVVDNTWLHLLLYSYQSGAVKDSAAKLREARGRLNALHEHLVAMENPPGGTASLQKRRDELNRILADPEFGHKKDDRLAELIREVRERVLGVIGRLLNSIFARIFGSQGEGGWIFRGFIIVVLVVVLAVVVRLLWGLRGRPRKKKKTVTILGEEVDEGTTSTDLAGAALSAAKSGDFRTAVRKLYIALLYGLAEKNIIELEANATNHEYLTEVSRHPGLAPPMRYMTDRFDYCWYGMFPVSNEEFNAYFSKYNEAIKNLDALNKAVTNLIKDMGKA